MKVALVIERYDASGGGAERWTDRHARYLVSHGIQVHLIAARFQDPPPDAICHEVSGGRGWGSRLRFAERVERLCLREGFDVVHDMGAGWHADIFHPHHGTRIAGLEQNLELLSPTLRVLQAWAYRWTLRYREFRELEARQYSRARDTTFVAVSKMVAEHMRSHFDVPAEKIRVIYNGVDTRRFHPARNVSLRQEMGWDDRVIYLLAAHNFALKGLDALMGAIARLRSTRANVALMVLGGDCSHRYRRMARRLGCADAIRFLGNQPDSVPYYQAADVYVHPTFYDPCSLVVLEALSCGLPVVTSQRNGAAEIMTPGQEGEILSDPKDVDTLAWAMSRFRKTQVRLKVGQRARLLAERYSLEANSSSILELYRRRVAEDGGQRRTA